MKNPKLALFGILLLIISLLASCIGAMPRDIMFISNRDGDSEIYLMRRDGSGVKQLTKNQAEDIEAAWSPDGARIVFSSNRDGNYEIYVMDADGKSQTRLTNHAQPDYSPLWSPDGSRIAFLSSREGNIGVYVMKADGSEVARLRHDPTFGSGAPNWSPDDQWVLFVSATEVVGEGISDIWIARPDGSNLTNLTRNRVLNTDPMWSPDGSKIVFASDRKRNFDLYIMNADGSGERLLTKEHPGVDRFSQWSPDGREVLFSSTREGARQELYVVDADGSNLKRLTNNEMEDFQAVWWPDGSKILFVRIEAGGNGEIYMMNSDGSGQTRLTNNKANDSLPRPRPEVPASKGGKIR